jgi:LysR family transcriptional regulator (chromosome initiation inhibitor)
MILLNPNLQAFFTIYESSTVSAAAQKLRIGQTAVTERLKSLERDLGATLFIRSRKGMTLTSEGKSLLKYCIRAKELEGEALSEIKTGGSLTDIHLKIAGPTSFISSRAVLQCKAVCEKWPRLNLHFIIDDRENRLELLKHGKADIVTLKPHQVPNECDSKKIKPDEYILLAHPSWKNRDLKDILENERLYAFHSDDHTSLNYLKTFNLLTLLKRPRLFANENLALASMLSYGVGYGILSKEIAAPWIESGKLIKLNQGRVMKDPLALAWYPRVEMPVYFKELVRAIS